MLFSVLQLTAMFLTFASAYFISKANLALSAKSISELAATKWGANLELAKSFAVQNGDNCMGVVALLLSLVAQIIITFYPHEEVFTINLPIVAISLGITALVALILGKSSSIRSRKLAQEAVLIIKTRHK